LLAKQNQIDTHLQTNSQLKDENHRLKSTIVNKDSENGVLQAFLGKEKDRREAETNELRKMLAFE
jgi:hypothetical protein